MISTDHNVRIWSVYIFIQGTENVIDSSSNALKPEDSVISETSIVNFVSRSI